MKKLSFYFLTYILIFLFIIGSLFLVEYISENKITKADFERLKDKTFIRHRYYSFYHPKKWLDKNGFNVCENFNVQIDSSIFFFGGSTTECLNLNNEDRIHSKVSELLLKKNNLKVNTYNLGVSGSNSLHSINLLINSVIDKKPLIAVLMHNVNDLAVLLNYKTFRNNNITRSNLFKIKNNSTQQIIRKKILKKDSFFKRLFPYISERFYFFKISLKKERLPDINEWDYSKDSIFVDVARILKLYENNMNTFIAICKVNNIKPILMTQFSEYNNGNVSKVETNNTITYLNNKNNQIIKPRDLHVKFNSALRKICLDENIPLIDLSNLFKNIAFNPTIDGMHYNEKGAHFAAKKISFELAKVLK